MKRAAILWVMGVMLTGCGDAGGPGEATEKPLSSKEGSGMFSGQVGDHSYNVPVTCSNLDKDYFSFLSDRTDSSDSNGDGIIISGMQNGENFVFTVIDHGVKYSTGRLGVFKKSTTGATGSGTLFPDGSVGTVDAQFTVDCG